MQQQIQKKGLYNEALQREVNILKNVQGEQNKLNISRQLDTARTSLQALEQKWEQQGILVGDFKAKVEALKTQLTTVGDAKGLSVFSTQLSVINSEAQRLRLGNINTANIERTNSQLAVLSNKLSTAQSKFQAFTGSMKSNAVSQFRGEIASIDTAFEKVKTAMAIS